MARKDGAWFDLDEVNYFTYVYWAAMMEVYLKGQNLWEIVCGREVEEPEGEDALRSWKITAEAALDALKASVQRKLEECIRNARRPKEAWDILAAKFSNTNHPPVQGNACLWGSLLFLFSHLRSIALIL